MSKAHPTAPAAPVKPAKPGKPYPEFPLTAHPAGYWCKKIRGKIHYFGPWADPDGALDKYLAEKDDLHAGRTPRPDPEGVTVKDAANAFLNHKRDKMDAGELSVRTWAKYKEVTDLVVKQFGKSRLVPDLRPADFTALKNLMTRSWGPLRVADFVQHVRSVRRLQTEGPGRAWKKLTPEKVRAIRAGWAHGKTKAAIAAENDVSRGQVDDLVAGRTFASIPVEDPLPY